VPYEKEWIGLLASSDKWPSLREGFFKRLKERAGAEEVRWCRSNPV